MTVDTQKLTRFLAERDSMRMVRKSSSRVDDPFPVRE